MIKKFAQQNKENVLNVIRDLCHIPAPSFGEQKRAAYCKTLFESFGAENVTIDEVNNTLFPLNCDDSNEITVIAAHLDTVFPDTDSYPEYTEDDTKIHCPGVGDDTASVAVLLYTAKYFLDNGILPPKGILFACNSCEEGLGNLVGIKQIMKTYAGRVKQFITLDAQIGHFVTVAVGSHRYEVEAITQGGHSYGNFGNKNAIAALADVIGKIYSITVPQKEGAKTTYNVGEIEGGTSVNTIAQSAKMLCEYRSNDREYLSIMQKHFADIFAAAQTDEVTLKITPVGERPCKGEVDLTVEQALVNAYCHAVAEVVGQEIVASPASTDANIPMSLGIASIDVGVYRGDGAHRREEWIEKDSVQDGLEIIIRMALALTNNNQ